MRHLCVRLLNILFILGAVFLLLQPSRVFAATGTLKQINFQGKVVNKTAGTNIADGSYNFTFSIYSVSSGGSAIWTETKSLTVTNGIFQTMLGDTTTLPGSVDFNTDNIYLGINFNSDGEMSPRVRFGAVPQALNALKVAGLTVTDTTGTLTIPSGKTISFADAFTTSGAFPLTLTTTASTNVTLPTTGTLVTLAGVETLTNKTIGSTGLTYAGATTDITTGTNEALTVTANGTGDVNLLVDADTNVFVTDGTNNLWTFGDGGEYGTLATTIGAAGGSANSLSITTGNTSGNYTGSLIDLTMDSTNADGFTGNGLRITADSSQTNGFAILLQDDAANSLFSVTDDGSVQIKNAFNEGGTFRGVSGGPLELQASGYRVKNFAQGEWQFITDQAAGSGGTFQTNTITLNALDGSDTIIGNYLNLTNANHTGTSNLVYGMAIAGITADADATETGLIINSGWDYAIQANGDVRLANNEVISNSVADTIVFSSDATAGAGALRLPVKTSTGDPTLNVEGNMYYNTVDNKFRCYQDTAWTDCIGTAGGGSSNWAITDGAIAPLNKSVDFLIGGIATSSAKFAVVNVNNGVPSASVSAGVSGATYLTANGTLSTTQFQNLTLGSSTNADILLAPGGATAMTVQQGGNIGVGTAPATGQKLSLSLSSAANQNNTALRVAALQTTAAAATVRGLDLTSEFSGTSGTQTGVNGMDFTVKATGSGGTVSFMKGISAWANVNTGATVGDLKIFHAVNPSIAGTVTTQYGMYIDSISGAGTNYALYSAGGQSYFAGNVGIGDQNPLALLTVGTSDAFQVDASGNITTTGDLALNGTDLTSTGILTAQMAGSGTVSRFQIGAGGAGSATPDYLGLDVKSTTGDPAGGAEGYMYYNTFDNKFRCFVNAAWADCDTTGGSAAFDTIGDAGANGAIAMAAFTQTLDWDTAGGTGALDGLTVTLQNDITTDASVQRAFVVTNKDDAGSTGTTDALIAVDNADSNEAVTAGLSITSSGAGGITKAIDIASNRVTTDISLQNGETIDNDNDGTVSIGTQTGRANLAVYGDVYKKGYTKQTDLANVSDTFIYDTTRDSDAGQWNEPINSSFLSWYSETKDDGPGDACVISSDDRCGASAFPKKAIITATADAVYIFDATDNSMWMKFTQAGTYALGADTNNNPSSVFALNGVVYVGTNGASGTGLYAIDFIQNRMYRFNTTNRAQGDVDIAARNSTVTYATDTVTAMQIRSNLVNDVHGAVIAGGSNIETNNAAANGITFIVAGTDASMSVININRKITWDFGSALTDKFTSVYLTKRGRLYGLNSTKAQVERFGSVPSSSNSIDFTRADSTTVTDTWDEATGNLPNLSKTAPTVTSNAPDALEVVERGSLADESADQIFVGTSAGLTEIDDVNSPAGTSIGWSRFLTTTSETNLMTGTPRGMFNLEDASGNITDSTIRNSILTPKGTPTYATDGVIGKAMTFNNSTTYLCSDANADATCDTDADFNVGLISSTIELWFKHSTTAPAAGTDVLVDHRYTAFAGAEGQGYTIEMNTTGQMIYGIQDTAATAAYDDTVTSTQSYNNNQWHHLVAVNTDTALCLYIDGNLAVACDTALAATLTLDASQILTIGADASGASGGNFWDGSIDQIYMSGGGATTSDTLTAAQVRKKYQYGRQALSRRSISVTAATAFSSNTIGDSGESWIMNEFVGSNVEITGGTGAGQSRKIQSNTGTVLTVSKAWTVTPDTTSNFEIAPEQLYGGTNTVTAIAMTDTDFLGAGRKLFVGTSDGADGGGFSIFSGGFNSAMTDIHHADDGDVDDSNNAWTGTDSDDIQSIDAKSNILASASLSKTWIESANQNYQASFDKIANNVNSVRSELVVDALAGTSFEIGLMGGADLAEYYGASESLTPGQIVALDPQNPAKVVPATRANINEAIGIVATSPGIILGEKVENAYPIALVGRVPVLVTAENGLTKAGERVTVSSEKNGYGARANFAGRVIGVALEDLKAESLTPCSEGSATQCGQVLTFVNLGDYLGGSLQAEIDAGSLTITTATESSPSLFDQKETALLAYLRKMSNGISNSATESSQITARTINALTLNVDTINANNIKATQIEGLEIYTNKLSTLEQLYSNLAESSRSAERAVLGASTSAQLAVELTEQSFLQRFLSQSKLIFAGSTEFKADSIFHGMTSFIRTVVFRGSVEFVNSPTFGQDTAGFLVIKAGQRSVDATFENEYSSAPIVTVTTVADVDQKTLDDLSKPDSTFVISKESYLLTNITNKGFTIILEKPADKDLKFSWIALSVKDVKTQTSTSTPVAIPSAQPSPSSGMPTPSPAPSPLSNQTPEPSAQTIPSPVASPTTETTPEPTSVVSPAAPIAPVPAASPVSSPTPPNP